MMFRRMAILAALMLGLAIRAAEPPSVGAKAPNFTLKTLGGESIELAALTAASPVVLVMLRGYPGYQCPLCTRQVNEFAGAAAKFAAKGARVVLVYPGPAPELQSRA